MPSAISSFALLVESAALRGCASERGETLHHVRRVRPGRGEVFSKRPESGAVAGILHRNLLRRRAAGNSAADSVATARRAARRRHGRHTPGGEAHLYRIADQNVLEVLETLYRLYCKVPHARSLVIGRRGDRAGGYEAHPVYLADRRNKRDSRRASATLRHSVAARRFRSRDGAWSKKNCPPSRARPRVAGLNISNSRGLSSPGCGIRARNRFRTSEYV